MHFLSPGAGLLAAAIAGPLLLILYLLRLRRRPARVSSIMFWPLASRDVQANEPLRWIRPSWLLALHALILALVALAIARPVWSGAAAARRIVLIIDASASMAAVDTPGGPSRLARAKERAGKVADEAFRSGAGREIAVVSLSADASLAGAFTSSRSAVSQAIDAIAQTDQPANLAAALRLAQACAADNSEQRDDAAQPPEAVLLSDGAFAPATEPPSVGLRVRFERIGASRPGTSPDNVGIVAFAAKRDDRDPTVVRIFADLLSSNASPTPVPLALSLNGAVAIRRAVTVPARAPTGEPGRTGVTFELPSADEGLLLLSIDRADALDADNRAGLMLPAPQRRTFVLVRPDSDRPAPAAWLLADALAELRPRELLTLTPDEFARRTPQDLAGVDLVIFDRCRPLRLPASPSISFGAAPPIPGLAAQDKALPLPSEAPLFWKRTSPVLRNTSLDALVVARATPMTWTPTPDAAATELITGPLGPLLLLIESRGVRRLVAGFELEQSNWPLLASFPIFLSDAADYLTLRTDQTSGRAFRSDQPALVRMAAGSGRGNLTLKGPMEVAVSPDGSADAGEVAVGLLPRAGVYMIEGSRAIDRAVAVNLADATESAVDSPAEVRLGRVAMPNIAAGNSPAEIWPYLIACLAALLMIEWFVYAWQVRA